MAAISIPRANFYAGAQLNGRISMLDVATLNAAVFNVATLNFASLNIAGLNSV